MTLVDDDTWEKLRYHAIHMMKNAYVPYSHFRVGAACLTRDGAIFSGCNIENASYGMTLCAECSMISAMICAGQKGIIAFYCVDGKGCILMPCGRCRQLLYEHVDNNCLFATPQGIKGIDEVLPQAFGPKDLSRS